MNFITMDSIGRSEMFNIDTRSHKIAAATAVVLGLYPPIRVWYQSEYIEDQPPFEYDYDSLTPPIEEDQRYE